LENFFHLKAFAAHFLDLLLHDLLQLAVDYVRRVAVQLEEVRALEERVAFSFNDKPTVRLMTAGRLRVSPSFVNSMRSLGIWNRSSKVRFGAYCPPGLG
jgi:hypothetical protein